MTTLRRDGVEICYEDMGDPAAPPILLIMGLGMQLTAWPESFCDALVRRGFRVIRLDNRDAGLSTHFHGAKTPGLLQTAISARIGRPPRLPYTLEDMANDAVAVLDALGLAKAHVVGASMGGMIAQIVAANHPTRTLSLVSIMSSSGNPWLKPPRRDILRLLLSRPPDGRDPEAVVAHMMRFFRAIGGPVYRRDEAELRARMIRAIARAYDPTGVRRQLLAIIASGDRRPLLRRINAPTLVIHGAIDPLLRPDAGRDTARNIRGAHLQIVDGMGHDLPEPLCAPLAGAVADHCAAASHTANRLD